MTLTRDSAAGGADRDDTRGGSIAPTGHGGTASAASWLRGRGRGLAAIVVATIALFVLSALIAPESLGGSALSAMLPFAAILGVVAIGQTLVVQQGGIDLSVSGAFSLAVVIVARWSASGSASAIILAIIAAIVVTTVAGCISGVLVARLRVAPIVATLGMNAVMIGVVWAVSGGAVRRIPSGLSDVVGAEPLGVPVTVIVAIALTAAVGFVMRRTILGRTFETVGANESMARAAGIAPMPRIVGAYAAAGFAYGVAGVLLTGIVDTPGIAEGNPYLLPSVAAVVLGGTSLRGGRGSVVASLVAALFFTQVDRLSSTLGLPYGYQIIVQAAALGLGVAFHSRAASLFGRRSQRKVAAGPHGEIA